MRAQTCDFKHNHGVKVGRIHSSSSNVLTPKAKQQQRAAGSSYMFTGNNLCSAVRCVSKPHCSAGWRVSVFSLYGILCSQDIYCNIIPLSTEAPYIRGILQHSAVLYQHLKMQTH